MTWLCSLQATVQAALALLPRDQVAAVYGSPPTTEQGQRYTEYAQNCLTAAVFAILICGSIGTLLIRIFAPVLLQKVSLVEAFACCQAFALPLSACGLWYVASDSAPVAQCCDRTAVNGVLSKLMSSSRLDLRFGYSLESHQATGR